MNTLQKIMATCLVGASTFAPLGCAEDEPIQKQPTIPKWKQAENEKDNIRTTVVSYLIEPRFRSKNFVQQLTGTKVNFERYNLNQGMLYFSIDKNDYKEGLGKQIAQNSKYVEYAKTKDGKFSGPETYLSGYIWKDQNAYLLRVPLKHFKVDPQQKLVIPYSTAKYDISLKELDNFISNQSVYKGYKYFDTGKRVNGKKVISANHSIFVATPNEPSLSRLVQKITEGKTTKEQQAQVLLSFVTNDLEYNGQDNIAKGELMKRPCEVIMTGGSDCGNLAVTYASLLEQTNIDYRLVYFDEHLSVGVEGNYPNTNGYTFTVGNKNFSIAETTCDNFQIGRTKLKNPLTPDNINFIQRPGTQAPIYDAKTGRKLNWD